MESCPQCGSELSQYVDRTGDWYVCGQCDGKGVPDDYVEAHFIDGDQSPAALMEQVQLADDEHCPSCGNLLELGMVEAGGDRKVMGRCDGCALSWFPGEMGRSISLPSSASSMRAEQSFQSSGPEKENSSESNPKFIEETSGWTVKAGWGDTPSNFSRWIPAFLGLPVKLHDTDGKPIGTWLLAVFMVGIFFFAPSTTEFVLQFGFTPDEWYRLGGLTAVTSIFLHGGLFHLIGNVYYFIVFGQDVEQVIGTGRYLLMILGAAVVGNVIYGVIQWGSGIPTIGASGGVAGVLAYFALAYPEQRFGYAFVPIIFYPIWLRLTAYWGFFIWVLFQLMGAHSQIQGTTAINALAHLGGAVVGIAVWMMLRER